MATPLTAFNKYTGVLMVILCAMLMISFVVADPLMQYAGGGAGGPSRGGETVATWKGGSMNERQLEAAVRHRRVLASFQRAVYQLGTRDAIAAGVGDLPLRVQPLELRASMEQGVERDVIQKKIFAERAQEAGMVVSDDMIVDYLRAIGRDRVGNEQMRGILSQMQLGSGRKATIDFMFDLLRDEMLANNYLVSHRYAFETVLPAERWEDWLRVNDRVSVEAAPIVAADLVDQIEEPSEAELAEFFEEYKTAVPSPQILRDWGGIELPSPTPAFATPPRVNLTYLEANFDQAVDRLAADITDEEVATYYKENLGQFVEADRALFGDDSLFEDDDTVESTESTTSDSEEAASDDSEQASESSEETETTAEDAGLEATEEEEEEEEQEDTADDEAAEGEATVSYRPLEEVADDIRRGLAANRAAEALQGLMAALKTELDDSYAEYFDKVLDAEDAELAPPAPPEALANLQPLAEANDLELVGLEGISQIELRESTVGLSVNADPTAPRALPAWFVAFRQSDLDLYQPMVTYDIDGNRYLILVTERLERVEPKLDDVRDQVVEAWKLQKASELALEKAKEIAAAVTESGKPLRDQLAGGPSDYVSPESVFETEPFSFLTIGTIAPTSRQVPLRLSQPEPLVAPGPDLLEAVFDLAPEEATAQLNHDHSIAYAVRIAQKQRTPDELRQEFVRSGDNWLGGQSLMVARVRRAASALILELLGTAELEWARQPDAPLE